RFSLLSIYHASSSHTPLSLTTLFRSLLHCDTHCPLPLKPPRTTWSEEEFAMSAPLVVSIPHRLGREEATRRLKAGLTRAAATIPDRKSTRLNSSHRTISYAVFCLKKK